MTYQMLPHPNLTEFPLFIKIKYYYHEGSWQVGLILEKKSQPELLELVSNSVLAGQPTKFTQGCTLLAPGGLW